MQRFMVRGQRTFGVLTTVAFILATSGVPAWAKSPVKLSNSVGSVEFPTDESGKPAPTAGITTFTLDGSASHLGNYTASGEVTFIPGEAGTLASTSWTQQLSAECGQHVGIGLDFLRK